MNISITPVEGEIPVTILAIEGELDAASFRDVMKNTEAAMQDGAQYIIVDMSELSFMSSSGLAALHSMTLMMQKVQPQETSDENESIEKEQFTRITDRKARVILLNPQPRVRQVLENTGFTEIFEIYEDLDAAVASCS